MALGLDSERIQKTLSMGCTWEGNFSVCPFKIFEFWIKKKIRKILNEVYLCKRKKIYLTKAGCVTNEVYFLSHRIVDTEACLLAEGDTLWWRWKGWRRKKEEKWHRPGQDPVQVGGRSSEWGRGTGKAEAESNYILRQRGCAGLQVSLWSGSKDIFRMGGRRDGAGDLRRQVREVSPSRRAAGSLCLTIFHGGASCI